MENLYNRRKIADEVYFTSITDRKFKVNKITVSFITALSDKVSENAIIPRMLVKCNEKLDTMAKLNRRLSELYSAGLSWAVNPVGDYQLLQLSASVLDNRYALENEDLIRETLDILLDCLFRPYFEDGFFPKQSFEIEKQNQKDDNDAEINDLTRFAYLRAYEEAFRGEPAEIRWGGTNKQVDAVGDKEAINAYRRMINEMRVEIICVGESTFDGVDKIFAEAFAKTERQPEKLDRIKISAPKAETERITETLDIEQSKLVMMFKTPCRDKYPLMVMQSLYGGTETSKLFLNVREKMSLCYFCFSRIGFNKGFISVECGVEEENLAKTETECLKQLSDIAAGQFTDAEIGNIKLDMINSILSMRDTINGLSAACLNDILFPEEAFPVEERLAKVKAVTREQIIAAAKTLVLDTVYILKPDKEAAK